MGFSKKKIFRIKKKKIDKDINNDNLNNKNNINEYVYDEIKEQKKIEDINQQDPIKMFIEFNKYAHIKNIKTDKLYYKHKKKFRFKKV
jgi:hypothetical protein